MSGVSFRRTARGFAGAWLALLVGCGTTGERDAELGALDYDEGLNYQSVIIDAPSAEVESVLRDALQLFTLAGRPPPSLARLRRRAGSDMGTAVKVLRSEGYYLGQASFQIEEPDLDPAPQGDTGADPDSGRDASVPAPEPGYRVVVKVAPGPIFTISDFLVDPGTGQQGPDLPPARRFGIAPGAPARAADIVEAEARAVDWLKDRGYPHARHESRTATADLEKHLLSVQSRLNSGPRISYGPFRFEGLKRVEQEYLASYQPWRAGDIYSRSVVDDLQTALFGTELFDSVSVEPPPREDIPAGEGAVPVPITIRAKERKPRTIGGGFRFSTDQGPVATGFLEHRNLFGANETGRFSVLAGVEQQELNLRLRKPQFLRDGQVLYGGLQVRHEDTDAFEEESVQLDVGIERRISRRLTVSGGGRIELSRIDDETRPSGTARLFGVPLTARYDASNSLLDPTRGFRLTAEVTPYVGSFRNDDLLFTIVDLHGSVYQALDERSRYVLAGRARAGSLFGAERDSVPSTKRLYSGGGGSVRGYEYRFIGPLNRFGDPLGGRSVVEAGLELRARISDTLGIVPFVDAGSVSDAVFPDLNEGVQLAAGLGLRYYTVVGPIRADVAFPLNPRDEDDPFQFYISIGHAF